MKIKKSQLKELIKQSLYELSGAEKAKKMGLKSKGFGNWEDPKTGLVWIPNTINEPGKGMVFANGTNKSNWNWAAVKSIEIPEE